MMTLQIAAQATNEAVAIWDDGGRNQEPKARW
jgi:hypothetical protein